MDHPTRTSEFAAIETHYGRSRDKREEYEKETEARKQELRTQIAQLQANRERAMINASLHAGNIGLIYRASSNNFSRVVVVDDLPDIPERPALPALDSVLGVDDSVNQHADQDPPISDSQGDHDQSVVPGVDSPDLQKGPERPRLRVPKAPPIPTAPVKPARPALRDTDEKWERATAIKSGFAWLFAILVGLFVGFGLLSLSGVPFQRPSEWPIKMTGFLLGVATICGMKLMMDVTWHSAGRNKGVGRENRWDLAWRTVLSAAFILIEAFLGGTALVMYSKKNAFSAGTSSNLQATLPLEQAVLIAIAISTATLVYSGFIGFQKGERSVTQDDLNHRDYELALRDHDEQVRQLMAQHEKEVAAWNIQMERVREFEDRAHSIQLEFLEDTRTAHHDRVAAWRKAIDDVRERHTSGIESRQERVDDLESFRKLPDFMALCNWIGVIESLNVRIEEVEKALTSESISRGYGKNQIF